MNERIRELKHQASLWCDENIPDQYSEETKGYGSAWEDKFAELSVRECADICMEMAAKCAGLPGDGALARDCADWIKKDFGVEEK